MELGGSFASELLRLDFLFDRLKFRLDEKDAEGICVEFFDIFVIFFHFSHNFSSLSLTRLSLFFLLSPFNRGTKTSAKLKVVE